MRRSLRRPLLRAPLVGLLAAGLVVVPAVGPAHADVVPSPGLGAAGVADAKAVHLSLRSMAHGLSEPVLVQTAPDGLSRLFVVERRGLVRSWTKAGGVASKPYLDIRGRTDSESGGERGMLGLAFSPRFTTDHHLWVTYTDSGGGLQISRFTASSAKATSVSTSTEVKVLRVAHPTYSNHNAGMLVFGREGLLYVSTGDGGGTGDPFANAQDLTTLAGKILRIDPFHGCSGQHYCAPADNPYAAPGGPRGAIWLYGLRNPWRFSVDRATGDLWIADVGQNAYEEITRVPYGQSARNLGWSCREARTVYNSSRCSGSATYYDPTIAYSHGSGRAVIGGYVYRGPTYASRLKGLYVYGDFTSGTLWVHGGGATSKAGSVGANRLSSFGEGDSGDLYATTLDGSLYKVVASAA